MNKGGKNDNKKREEWLEKEKQINECNMNRSDISTLDESFRIEREETNLNVAKLFVKLTSILHPNKKIPFSYDETKTYNAYAHIHSTNNKKHFEKKYVFKEYYGIDLSFLPKELLYLTIIKKIKDKYEKEIKIKEFYDKGISTFFEICDIRKDSDYKVPTAILFHNQIKEIDGKLFTDTVYSSIIAISFYKENKESKDYKYPELGF